MPRQSLQDIFAEEIKQMPDANKAPGQAGGKKSLDEIFGKAQDSQERKAPSGGGVFSFISSGMRALGEFGAGAMKGVASLPVEAASLGKEVGFRAAAAVRPDATYEDLKRSIGEQTDVSAQIASGIESGVEKTEQMLAPKTGAEKAGFAAEKVAEFFVPAGAATKAKALESVSKIASGVPKIVAKGADLLARAGMEGMEQAARVALQTGGDEKATKEAFAVGATFPLATPVLKGLGSIGKNVLKTVSSKLSGVPTAAIEHAFANPLSTKKAIRAMSRDPVIGAQGVLSNAEEALKSIKNVRREAYKEALAKVEQETMTTRGGQLYVKRLVKPEDVVAGLAPEASVGKESFVATKLSLKGVKDTITKTLKDFGASAKGAEVSLEKVALPGSYKKDLEEIVNKVYSWDDITPSGLDDLRENISVFEKSGISMSSADKKFNKIVGDIRRNISSYVGDRVPQIRKMNEQYAAHSETVDNIIQELSLGRDRPSAALRRLTNVFNPRSEVYRPIVKALGEKGGKDLMTDIAGLTMAKWTPEGLGAYLTTLGGLGAVVAPKTLLMAPLASPRVVGEAASAAGTMLPSLKKVARPVGKVLRGVAAQALESREETNP